jgi:hypothetical protein
MENGGAMQKRIQEKDYRAAAPTFQSLNFYIDF